jgi:hypothetical protein
MFSQFCLTLIVCTDPHWVLLVSHNLYGSSVNSVWFDSTVSMYWSSLVNSPRIFKAWKLVLGSFHLVWTVFPQPQLILNLFYPIITTCKDPQFIMSDIPSCLLTFRLFDHQHHLAIILGSFCRLWYRLLSLIRFFCYNQIICLIIVSAYISQPGLVLS